MFSNRIYQVAVLFLATVVMNGTCFGNLLPDPGFEEGKGVWEIKAPVERYMEGASEGQACLKIPVKETVNVSLVSMKIERGNIYRLKMCYRLKGKEPRMTSADKIVIRDKASRKHLGQWWMAWSQSYMPLELYFNSGTTEEIEIMFNGQKDTEREVYLDDFLLEKASGYLPMEQGFEGKHYSEAPFCFLLMQHRWYKETETGFSGPYGKELIKAAGIKLELDKQVYGNGRQSLRIEKSQKTETVFHFSSTPIPVEPGKDYEVSFNLRGLDPKTRVCLWIQGNVINPMEKHQRQAFYFSCEETWKECKAVVSVPGEGKEGYVSVPALQLYFHLLPEFAGTIWLDKIVFREVPAATSLCKGNMEDFGYYRSFFVLPQEEGRTNLVVNSSFECGLANWYDALFSGYQGVSIVREVLHGNYCLRLEPQPPASGYVGYRGVAGIFDSTRNRFRVGAVVSNYKIPIEKGKPYTLSFWARADEEGRKVFVGVIGAAPGKWIDQSGITAKLSKEWRRYETVVKTDSRAVNISINFPQYDGPPASGIIWIDALQFEEGDKATDYGPRYPVEIGILPVRYGNVFKPGEKVECNLVVANHESEKRELKVNFTIADFTESPQCFTQEVSVPGGAAIEQKIALPLTNAGFYNVYAQATVENMAVEAGTKLAIIEPVTADPYFALCANHWCTLEGLKLWLPLTRQLGVNTVRVIFNYFCVNHPDDQEGELYFKGYDSGVDEYRRYGFNVMATLGCGLQEAILVTLYDSKDKEVQWPGAKRKGNWKDFLAYIEKTTCEIAKHYKGKIEYFELWNEPNCWGGAPEGFYEYEMAAVKGLRAGNPDVKIVGPCSTAENWEFVEGVCKAGGLKEMDVLSHHFYGLNSDMEAIAKGLHQIAERYGKKNIPVWNTELCGAIVEGNEGKPYLHERRQSAEMVKTMTACKACGVDKYFYFLPDELGGSWPWRSPISYGLFDYGASQLTPTLRYPVYAAIAKFLGNAQFLKEYKWTENHVGYLFQGSDDLPVGVIFSWPCLQTKADLKLPLNRIKYRIFNIDGSEYHGAGDGCIPVTGTPFFIKAEDDAESSAEEFMAAFDKAVFSGVSVSIANFTLNEKDKAVVELENSSKTAVKGAVSIRECGLGRISEEIPVALNPFEIKRIEVPFKYNRWRFGLDWRYQAALKLDKDTVVRYREMRYLNPCIPAGRNVVVDGNLEEWGDAFGLGADREDQVELYLGTKWSGIKDLSAVFFAMWDKENLYLAAKVTDDVFCQKEAEKSWLGDSVQFALDFQYDGLRQQQGVEKDPNFAALERARTSDRALNLSLYQDKPRVEFVRFTDTKSVVTENNPADIKAAISIKGNEVVYEAKVPFKLLMDRQPASGIIIGFLAMVNDNDGEGRKLQLQAPYYIPEWPANWQEFSGMMLITPEDLEGARSIESVEKKLLDCCRKEEKLDSKIWSGNSIPGSVVDTLHNIFGEGVSFATNVMKSSNINVYGYQANKDVLLIVSGSAQRQVRMMLSESLMKRLDLAVTVEGLPVELSKDSIPVNAYPYIIRIKNCRAEEVKIGHIGGYGEAFD